MPVSLGVASGRIIIDTSQVGNARVVIEREARIMTRAFDDMGKKADTSFVRIGKSAKQVGDSLKGLSLVSGGLSLLGARGAASLEQLRIRFEAIAGSQAKGDKLMASIAKRARELNQPVRQVQEAFAGLVPFLRGGQKELDRYVGLVARLATLNPREGAEGAVFAIREAMSSGGKDLVSLSERFNLPRKELRALIEDTGDFGTALDMILTKFGATENVAKKMGNTFATSLRVFLSEGEQLLSAVMKPMLEFFTPIIKQTTSLVRSLQEANPAILGLAGGFLTLATAITPVALGLSKVVSGLRLMKQFSGTGVGKVAIGVGAVATGAQIGVGLVNKLGEGYGDERLKNYQMGDALNTIIQLVGTAFLGLVTIVLKVAEALAGFAFDVSKLPEKIQNFAVQRGFKTNDELRIEAEFARFDKRAGPPNPADLDSEKDKYMAPIYERGKTILEGIAKAVGALGTSTPPAPPAADTGGAGLEATPSGISSDELAAFQDYKDDVAKIETDAQQDRLEATEDYEAKKTETEADYQRERGEMVADEAKRRRRDEEKLARDITEAQKEGGERAAETIRDRDEKITEIREETQQQELREIEDYHRERLKAERDHRENLLEAASRLDARAVFEELRSFRNKTRDAGENHRTEIRRDRENAQERIEQETEESTSRLEEIRRGTEERIAELQAGAEIERRQREEDFQEKLARFDAEHVREMGKLDQQHRDRINEINQNAIDEKTARKTQWTNEVLELGGHGARMLQIQRGNHAAMEAEYMQFLAREAAARQQAAGVNRPTGALTATNVYRMQSDLQPSRTLPPPVVRGTAFQEGTSRVPFTGMFGLHRGEAVMRPDVAALVRSVLGPSFTQPQLAAAVAGGARGGLSIPVTITALPGMSPHDIAQLVAAEVEPAVQRIMDGDR